MKKRTLLIAIVAVVVLAGGLAVKAAKSRTSTKTITKGTIVADLTSATDKNFVVSYGGKNYTIWVKPKAKKLNYVIPTVKKCTKLTGNAFANCKKAKISAMQNGDKIKIKAKYYKASKMYVANQIWFYRPPAGY